MICGIEIARDALQCMDVVQVGQITRFPICHPCQYQQFKSGVIPRLLNDTWIDVK